MAYQWEVKVVQMDLAEETGLGAWEPFAVVEDDEVGPCVVVKRYSEVMSDKHSEVMYGDSE